MNKSRLIGPSSLRSRHTFGSAGQAGAAPAPAPRTSLRSPVTRAPAEPPRAAPRALPPALAVALADGTTLQDLAALADADAGLARALLQASGNPRQTLAQAIVGLGLEEARLVVLAHALRSGMPWEAHPGAWERCLHRAGLGRMLAEKARLEAPWRASAVGMLQEAGTLALAAAFPHLSPAFGQLQALDAEARRQVEVLLAGCSATEALLEHPLAALLPEPIHAALAARHAPGRGADLAGVTASIDDALADEAEGRAPAASQGAQRWARQILSLLPAPSGAAQPPAEIQAGLLASLPGRGRCLKELEQLLSQARRSQDCFSLLVFDVDRLQQVNNAYGQPAGDLVLSGLIEALLICLRQNDRLFRLGGDGFAILLADTRSTGGQVVAERLRALAEQVVLSIADVRLGCTISLYGVTATPDATAAGMLAAAESGLATSERRNRTAWQPVTLLPTA